MEIIELGHTPMIVNAEASAGASAKGVSIDIGKVASLPKDHHIITLPLEEKPFKEGVNKEAIENLESRLEENKEELVRIKLHGQELKFDLKAALGEAEKGNDFDIEGKIINFYKAE